ncbi:MAG: 2-oxo acid dehydrogenase subunit E2 [Salinisphaera sp.]|nr:2-oxo acid dehydrogenase subunit E2 [Salinisphaera sp.]
MSKEYKLSDPGEGLHEAEVLEVHVKAGDEVAEGDVVLTVETDKANTDLPAPFSGTIAELRVSEGDMAEVGDVLMTYDEGGQAPDKDKQSTEDADHEDDQDPDAADDEDDDDAENKDGDTGDADPGGDDRQADTGDSDADRDQADDDDAADGLSDSDGSDAGGDKNADQGTDKAAQDAGDDEEKNDDKAKKARDESQPADNKDRAQKSGRREPVAAAPSTRRLAREKGVDLHDVEGSGKQGRVTAEDVEAAAQTAAPSEKGKQGRGAALIPGGGQAPPLPDFSQWGEVERSPLRSIRRATAQHLARAWTQIPHVFHQDIADVTALERFRHEHEDAAETGGGKFTLTVLVIKALAAALKQFPRFNASLDPDNQEIVFKRYCHIGLAVATDRGLLVPVLRNVDRKNLIELSTEAADLARKTRNGEVKREDMQGGCITVTNPGPMGGTWLTPIINYPQVAILGMGQARLEPVVRGTLDDYQIEPRLRLPLVLGFDHRVNDGAEAARFVTHLIDSLADPESLLLQL